jgi:hypothetical protein
MGREVEAPEEDYPGHALKEDVNEALQNRTGVDFLQKFLSVPNWSRRGGEVLDRWSTSSATQGFTWHSLHSVKGFEV